MVPSSPTSYKFMNRCLALLVLIYAPLSYAIDFSSEECIKRIFPMAAHMPKTMVPTPAILYCAYPWDEEKLLALASVLHKAGVKLDSLAADSTNLNDTARSELALSIQMKYRLPYPDSIKTVVYLSDYLTLAWAVAKGSPSIQAVVKKSFTPDFFLRLKNAATAIKWDENLLQRGMIQSLPLYGGRVRFITSAFDIVNPTDIATWLPVRTTASQELLFDKNALTSSPLFARMQELVASGFVIDHAQVIGLVEAYIGLMESEAKRLQSDKDMPVEWKPLKKERTRTKPLTIYWTQSAPQTKCSSKSLHLSGQYCEATDEVYARPAERRVGDNSFTISRMGFQLFHEIGHAFLNPVGAADSPFITEGIITSLGESQRRALSAAQTASGSITEKEIDLTGQILQSIEGSAVSDSTIQKALAFSTKNIRQVPLGAYEREALCRAYATPLTFDRLISWLSKSAGNFQSMPEDDRQLGYAHGWAMYHFGLDLSKVTETTTFSQINASVVQIASSKRINNQELSKSENDSLSTLISRLAQIIKTQGDSICQK